MAAGLGFERLLTRGVVRQIFQNVARVIIGRVQSGIGVTDRFLRIEHGGKFKQPPDLVATG